MLPTFPTVLQSHDYFVEIVLLSKTSAKSRERRRRGHCRLESFFPVQLHWLSHIAYCLIGMQIKNLENYRHMNRIEAPHMQSFMIQAFSAKDMTSEMLVQQNKFTSPRTGVWSVVESNIFAKMDLGNWRILRSQISSIHFSASIDIDFGAGGVQGTWHVDVPKSQVKGKHNYFAEAPIENPRNFEFFCLWRSTLSLQHGKKETHLKAVVPRHVNLWRHVAESPLPQSIGGHVFLQSVESTSCSHQPCVVVVVVVVVVVAAAAAAAVAVVVVAAAVAVVVVVETGHATSLVAMLHWILYEGFHQVSPIYLPNIQGNTSV